MEKLHKVVDGKKVYIEEEEEKHLRHFWSLNESYREYSDSIIYDGSSMPSINMDRAKQLHKLHTERLVEKKLKEINHRMEIAQEESQDLTDLFLERKKVRELLNQDISEAKNLDDLKSVLLKYM